MKEGVRERGGGIAWNPRSAAEKERTKMRERRRRSITTNIFHGLRKHGGYCLSPRADINEVLRHLAREAGWIVEPDGTTYRSPTTNSHGTNACPLCGGGAKSTALPTPSCSYLGGGGECSTTTSPRRVAVGDSAANKLSAGGLPSLSSTGTVVATNDALLAIYMCGAAAAPQNACASDAARTAAYAKGPRQFYLFHEESVSNHITPARSPRYP